MISTRLTREQWGAAPIGRKPTRVSSMRGCAVHWVGPAVWGSAGIGDHSKCAGKVRGIQRAHMAGEYYDIAYSEVVCPHGQRFEGRGHHVQVGANGSSFANERWYAILALVGEGDKITPELLRGIGLAVADYRRNADAGVDVTGHRFLLKTYAGRTTECPGDVLYGHATRGAFDKVDAGDTEPPVALRRGDTGPYVTALQLLLIARGYDIAADGSYGPATEGAVSEFQAASGLTVDGIAGPQTQAALTTSPEEDDMPTPSELWRWDGIPSPDGDATNPTWQADSYLRETFRLLRTVRAEVGALRAVVAELGATSDVTAETITAAAKAGAASALDEKIADATTVLGVKVEGLTP